MNVILSIGRVRFLTTADKAAKVATLLGSMKQVDSKYWDNGKDIHKDQDFKNGTCDFICGDSSVLSRSHIVEISQKSTNSIFASEAQADEFISTMKEGGDK